jgi:hypothetical protein
VFSNLFVSLCSGVQVIGTCDWCCYVVLRAHPVIPSLIILFNRCLTKGAGLQATVWQGHFIGVFMHTFSDDAKYRHRAARPVQAETHFALRLHRADLQNQYPIINPIPAEQWFLSADSKHVVFM